MKSVMLRYGGAALVALTLAGCGGGDSPAPVDPTPPPAEVLVPVPTGTSPITITANTPAATFAALSLKVNVGKIVITDKPVVNFSITDADGNAVIGFGSTAKSATATVASYPNISFGLAKLVPGTNGSPSQWVSYLVTRPATTTAVETLQGPGTDNIGTLVDNKNGTYAYTFYRDVVGMKAKVEAIAAAQSKDASALGDLTYDANATHRLAIIVSGAAPGTGSNTANAVTVVPAVNLTNPINLVYDFIPATGKAVTSSDAQRAIVDKASCNECHGKLGGIPGTETASFHSGARFDPGVCSVCHTDQRKYGATNAVSVNNVFPLTSAGKPIATALADGVSVGNLPIMVHKIHMGGELVKKNYDFGGVLFNETKYPQDIRNCTKCHDNSATAAHPTPQGDNWKNKPSVQACSACHDGIDFKTNTGVTLSDAAAGLTVSLDPHPLAGPQADDSKCSNCHNADTLPVSHLPVTPPNLQNSLLVAGGNNNTAAAFIAGNLKSLPAGAITVSYDIKSAAVNATTRQPSIVFRMLQNGTAVPFNDPAAKQEMWDNFVGSPSAYFVFAVPQDGITAPADFNASVSGYLRNIWNGTATGTGAGTLTYDAATGYYTVTLTGVKIPTSAVMVTAGLGYSYGLTATQPLTQTNLPAYPVADNALGLRATPAGTGPLLKTGGLIVATQDATKVATGYTGRRTIVADGKCDKCHEQLGVFTAESFHAGQRNDGASCSWCHTPNRTSSAWSADSIYFVHAIHGGSKRTTKFTWHAATTTESFADVGYPGVLSNCETCHVAGSYDFSASANAAAVPNRLYRTVGTGKYNGTVPGSLTTFSLSPYVLADNVYDYGNGFSFNAAAASQVTTPAAATTLVISPITAACFSCHDSAQATAHMEANGGQIYNARGTLPTVGVPGSGSGALGALGSGNGESCLVCHGAGKVADIKAVHPAVTQ